ncbi:MAG: hypothetical protein V7646_50 [Pseudonocardia sp.]
MESPAHSNGHRHGSSNRVPVAQLIIRCGEWRADPLPSVDYGSPAPISVGTLRRREGCAPHAADRPLQPRGHSRPPAGPPEPPRRNLLRKATAAAGVLFAAGAMSATAGAENVVRAPRGAFELGADGGTAGDRSTGPSSDGGRVDAQWVTFSVAELKLSAATAPGVGSSVLLPIASNPEIGRGVSGDLRNAAAPGFGGAGGSAAPGGAGAVTPAGPGAAEPVAAAARSTGAGSAPPLGTDSGSPASGGLLPGLLPGNLGPCVIAPGGGPGGGVPGDGFPGSRNDDSGDDSGRSSSNDSDRGDSGNSGRGGSGSSGDSGSSDGSGHSGGSGLAGIMGRAEWAARPRGLSPGG